MKLHTIIALALAGFALAACQTTATVQKCPDGKACTSPKCDKCGTDACSVKKAS